MNDRSEVHGIELICIIVNYGIASKILKFAKNHGITGGTITLGYGTVNNHILDLMGLCDIRKEIIFMATEKEVAYKVLEELNREFEFLKPNHGIAFTSPICGIMGTKCLACGYQNEERGEKNIMYHTITAIVDKGKGEDVVTAATKAGSKGGTIINARGSGIHETKKIFSMDIEPEKEIVIILSEADMTEKIAKAIKEDLKMDEAGNGIIYVQNVNKTYGIHT